MGCDIHAFAEKITENGYQLANYDMWSPFKERNYEVFSFLAGVKNYSMIKPISSDKGIPADASRFVMQEFKACGKDAHSASYLDVRELLDFDYDKLIEDRRCKSKIGYNAYSCSSARQKGNGKTTTYREFLGKYFFDDLLKLKRIGATRVVFWFDN